MRNFFTGQLEDVVGKSTAFLASLGFGGSAAGFIIGFAEDFGFHTNSPIWSKILIYGGAACIGANAGYRMWAVTSVGSPHGLKLIFSQNKKNAAYQALQEDSESPSTKMKLLKVLGLTLSACAGTTYGGLSYLGISNIVKLDTLWWEISSGVVVIGSTFIAAGALFSFAWIQNLNAGTLFTRNNNKKSNCYVTSEIISACMALFGLGCTMTLGSLGLTKSIGKLPDMISTTLGSVIAVIGFFGEAPFSIKQGRLLIHKLSKVEKTRTPTEKLNGTENKEIKNSSSISLFVKIASTLVYTTNSFAGTYADIGNFSTPLRTIFATGSAYLALVSSLEESPAPEKTQSNSQLSKNRHVTLFSEDQKRLLVDDDVHIVPSINKHA